MAQSLSQIYIHLIFHIKSNGVKIKEEDCSKVFAYIDGILVNKGSLVVQIGGRPDHIHILCTLPRTISIADFVEDIKKSSSKWIKTVATEYATFALQGGYGVFSVSASQLEKTRNYILNQEEHHKKKSFKEEYEDFLVHYNVKYDSQYVFSD